MANFRGGGEEGEEWHRAGTFDRKQDVFDDFHAAAQRLIADGWTTPAQLSINGCSNGGLLVGAALTQRPELYAAAVCAAPLLDMVRYEHFALGALWNVEYGTADDPQHLGWLLAYSPYHHVREGVAYPATLFTVFDGDTRVDPMHARKMCAALQQPRPVTARFCSAASPMSATIRVPSAVPSIWRRTSWSSWLRRPDCAPTSADPGLVCVSGLTNRPPTR